ncbi:MAG: glycosyltransferase family 39 protein [Nitrospirota bacterium]
MSSLKKIEYILPVSFLSLSIFLTLFVFRFTDDNRLISWNWVFNDSDIVKISFILVLSIIIAYLVSTLSFPERVPSITLFLFSFVAILPFWREPEVIVDVSRYFTQAKHLELYGTSYFLREWGKDIMAWTDMPLIPFLYGIIFKFFGENRIYIQVFTTLLFSTTVVLTYNIGKTLWDENTGYIAGLLLLGIPYLFTQIPLVLVDVPTMFFLTFSIFTFIKAMEKGRIWMNTVAAVAIFFAIFSKYSTWPMLSILVIIFLVYRTPNSKLRTHNYIYRSLVIALISGALTAAVFLSKLDFFLEQIKFLMTYQKAGLGRWSESFTSTFLFQIHPFITVSALYSAYVAFRKRDIRYVIISWLFIIVVLFQIKRIRYIIPLFPMFTLMASYGLQHIMDRELRRFVVSCIVFFSLSIAIFAYLPLLQKMSAVNLMDAGKFLNSLDIEEVEVLILPSTDTPVNPAVSVPALDLFTRKKVIYSYNPEIFHPEGEIEKSPLRFTWEYKNPIYYNIDKKNSKKDVAIVVISSDSDQTIPYKIEQRIKNFQKSKVFRTSEEIFRYKTFVTIYYD